MSLPYTNLDHGSWITGGQWPIPMKSIAQFYLIFCLHYKSTATIIPTPKVFVASAAGLCRQLWTASTKPQRSPPLSWSPPLYGNKQFNWIHWIEIKKQESEIREEREEKDIIYHRGDRQVRAQIMILFEQLKLACGRMRLSWCHASHINCHTSSYQTWYHDAVARVEWSMHWYR